MLKRLQRLREFGYVLLDEPRFYLYIDSHYFGYYCKSHAKKLVRYKEGKIPLESLRNIDYVRYRVSCSILPDIEKIHLIDSNNYKNLSKKDVFLEILLSDLEILFEKKFNKFLHTHDGIFYRYDKEKDLVVNFLDNRTFKNGVKLEFETKIYFKRYF